MNRHRYSLWNQYSMMNNTVKSKLCIRGVKKSFLFTHLIYISYTFNERADSQHWANRIFNYENWV